MGAMIFQEENLSSTGLEEWAEKPKESLLSKRQEGRGSFWKLILPLLSSLLGNRGKIKKTNSLSLGGGYFERLISPAAAEVAWWGYVDVDLSSLITLIIPENSDITEVIKVLEYLGEHGLKCGARRLNVNNQLSGSIRTCQMGISICGKRWKTDNYCAKTLGSRSKLETIITDLSYLINNFANKASQTNPLILLYSHFY